MTVTAASPDGQVSAEISWYGEVLSLTFCRDAYRRYIEPVLAHQLAQLATLLWTRQRRYYREIIDATFDHPIHDDAADIDPKRRPYNERLSQITVEAESDDRAIKICTEGMQHWTFTISPGTLSHLPEDEFIARISKAARQVMTAYRGRMLRLREEFYGPLIPGGIASGDPSERSEENL
jgi:hypothetical protein